MLTLRINNAELRLPPDICILNAALTNGIYLPHLCAHPDLPPAENVKPNSEIYQGNIVITNQNPINKQPACELCLVEIDGTADPQKSCATLVQEGMIVHTDTPALQSLRQDNLAKILADHPHVCLTCAQQQGCSITQCSTNVPVNERCCPEFGRCELQKVAEYIGIKTATPRYQPADLPVINNEPLFHRDYNLCIGCTRCVRICREVRGIEALGFVWHDGKVKVGTRQPALKESDCKFCGACVEVCPTGALRDKDIKASDRKIDLIPCQYTCPAEINVPEYIRLIKQGKETDAAEIIREKAPLPGVLSRVCFHPCEEACRRNHLSNPIAICTLKRFAIDSTKTPTTPKPPNPKPYQADRVGPMVASHQGWYHSPIAVIGAGPTGLTASHYLTRLGYPVTVFEAESLPGGMMRYAIPSYRLPEDVLEQDLKYILGAGITLKTNQTLGKDFTIENLKKDGFEAIFIAIGAQRPKAIRLAGLNLPHVHWGIDFLKAVRHRKPPPVQNRVLVIGGGNVAIDAALTVLRLGAAEVQLVCLESPEEMPAHQWEIEQAREEGVIINCGWGPSKILHQNGQIKGVELTKCTRVFDEINYFAPTFDNEVTRTIQTQMVILAIGQVPDNTLSNTNLELTSSGTIKTDEASLQTSMKGVFAGGEVVHNPGSVIDAIADGRRAASAIDKYLGGDGKIDLEQTENLKPEPRLGREQSFTDLTKIKVPCLTTSERIHNFNPIEQGYNREQALNEAKRCLQCDLRLHISPITLPPQKEEHLEFNQANLATVPETAGIYQLLDETQNVISIKGTSNLKQSLQEQLESRSQTRYFTIETNPFYTKRESELLQQFLQKHGRMPGGNDELDDLF